MHIDRPKIGQLWMATRNPYPIKGHPRMSIAWDIGETYRVVQRIPMKHGYPDIIGFKSVMDERPMGGWEIGEDSFCLGFVLLE
jgi:hypothetical protein